MPLRALLAALLTSLPVLSQQTPATYTNPVLFSDYSDPDVIRDGNTYYLVASSFSFVPGLPILQSPDLVHWTIVAHALPHIPFGPKYDLSGGNRYGGGVWAPALRKHDGRFLLYFPTPDEGIFMVSAPAITGPWTEPVAVLAQPGLEDPCPFWDDDGQAYLVHSRKGAGPLILHRMSPDGKTLLDQGKVIVDDPVNLHTLEGPKLYKRNGFYYIFAPFGGVGTGAQTVLRSRNILGPYEHRTVLAQGSTAINGPHQGGYVETPDGQGWFLHFQSRAAHGRIDHLEPVRWEDDWPIIGDAPAGATTGQPVATWPMPHTSGKPSTQRPTSFQVQTSDDFNSSTLGQQWEWNHNPDDAHWSLSARRGFLRLTPTPAADLFTARNTLTQQMQDQNLDFTVRLDLSAMTDGTHTGLAMFEKSASGLEIVQHGNTRTLSFFHTAQNQVQSDPGTALSAAAIDLRVHVESNTVTYSYSIDQGRFFHPFGPPSVPISFSWWKGSRPAVFAFTTGAAATPAGHVDLDFAHYTALPPTP